jgi:hypothetical protein
MLADRRVMGKVVVEVRQNRAARLTE